MFRILLVVVFILSANFISAQSFIEVKAGLAKNWVESKMKLDFFDEVNTSHGLYLSGSINHRLNEKLGIGYGLVIMQKGFELRRDPPFQSIYKRVQNYFLQVPISLDIQFLQTKRVSISSTIGFFAGYWIQSRVEGTIPNAFDAINSLTENGEVIQNFSVSTYRKRGFYHKADNRFETGAIFGLKLMYAIRSRYHVVSELAYNYAFTPLSKSTLNHSNRTLIPSIGVVYHLMKASRYE